MPLTSLGSFHNKRLTYVSLIFQDISISFACFFYDACTTVRVRVFHEEKLLFFSYRETFSC